MSHKKEWSIVMLLIAAVLIGAGVGMITSNLVAGVLIALGTGFALAVLISLLAKN
ncbi:hypothetical protein ACFL3C_01340 [Patescibacteria group bacterium]